MISSVLLSAHAMIAGATKTPELELDEKESRTIAEASAKVAEFYDLNADPKIIAWCNLAMVLGTTYGTRIFAINIRKKRERSNRAEKVTPIRPNVGVTGIPEVKLPGWDTSPIGPDGKPTKQ